MKLNGEAAPIVFTSDTLVDIGNRMVNRSTIGHESREELSQMRWWSPLNTSSPQPNIHYTYSEEHYTSLLLENETG